LRASEEEKKKVFKEAIRRANEKQLEVLNKFNK